MLYNLKRKNYRERESEREKGRKQNTSKRLKLKSVFNDSKANLITAQNFKFTKNIYILSIAKSEFKHIIIELFQNMNL